MRFFICGSAMRGQPDHGNLGSARFLGEALTAPRYRLHSVLDRHPGIYEVAEGGVSIAGELYEFTEQQHRDLLASEPPDLYEGTIVLSDGSTASAMVYPRELIEQRGYPDVSSCGGWAAYKASLGGTARITIDSLDHFVMTVRDPDATIAFYRDVLGMQPERFDRDRRIALKFGKQKINIHVAGHEFEPKADVALPGTADVCFLTSVPIDDVVAALRSRGIAIVQGPVDKTGAQGKLHSVYVRDPDRNLVEISNLVR
jgi:gamma-glutamylaminecyclotransferase